FWMWWEETVNFVPEEHKVDFVIISDNSPSLLEIPKEYGLADGTKWSLSVIRKACESIFKDDNAEFYENGTMRFAVKNGFSNAATRFYINRFNLPKNNETKSGSNAQDGFMDYFLGDKLPDIIVKDIIH
ncbi:MAG: hypothetical protein IJS15_06770, partial [Victivallales bacterium]|nr:hypothetical protein [Victivallales bacterium]